MLQLNIWQLEIGDEVVEGLEDLLDGQGDHCPVLKTQRVEVSERMQTKILHTLKGRQSRLGMRL